jgi:dCTP deaminase
MSLSDNEIRKAARKGEFKISPRFSKINPAGLDLRVDRDLIITPYKQRLVASLERVELSPKLVGILHIRSSLAREGLFASLALVDPGFRGQLTVSLYNAGDRPVMLKRGERFIQLSLFRLGEPAEKTYNGRYQESAGVVRSRRRKKSYTRRMESIIQRSVV